MIVKLTNIKVNAAKGMSSWDLALLIQYVACRKQFLVQTSYIHSDCCIVFSVLLILCGRT